MLFLKGHPAAGGIARGRLMFLDQPTTAGAGNAPARTLEDFRRALRQTEIQLERLQQQMEQRLEDAAALIFSAHLLMLKGDAFSGAMIRAIKGGAPPAAAEGVPPDLTPETAAASGERFRVMANMNLLSDLLAVREMKAEGVGLYRAEFPFIVRHDFPSEEEQCRIYRRILDELSGQEVVFHTLDIGGDKMLSYYPTPGEANPFLGLRAIRFSLRNQAVFSQQIRALLRAGSERELSILFPMIASLDEWLAVRSIVQACVDALAREGIPHQAAPRLGAMIEVSAAMEIAEELAAHADFLSIGTNDLVQYLLAVDRTNEQISDLYQSHHPAVLRALHRVAQAALRRGRPVSVCGDMAADRRMIPFLAGIGIRTFSVNPRSRPACQLVLRGLDLRRAEEQARGMLKAGTLREVEALMAPPE